MRTIMVQVKSDHIRTLSRTRKPILAVAELIWNAVDADATLVQVVFNKNELTGLSEIRVLDNGHGIAFQDVVPAFESLGGSWKRAGAKTKGKRRLMHGRLGKGRFRAFALGHSVEWHTCYQHEGEFQEYVISSSGSNLGQFQVSDPRPSRRHVPGTEVIIRDMVSNLPSLLAEDAHVEIAQHFALYMRQYPDLAITYAEQPVDPRSVENRVTDHPLSDITLTSGQVARVTLTVIEWKTQQDRDLFLCDSEGFTLDRVSPGIQAPGFSFSAYLKSDFLRELDEQGALALEDLDPDVTKVLTAARDKLQEHFRQRSAEASVDLVEEWKEQHVYPYEGEPKDVVEQAERQVFDVVALNVNAYLPEFDRTELKNKRLALTLLRHALESSPRAVQRIMGDVLGLPAAKQEELAGLLERTSLAAIISASKVVADRLDFLRGLELLVFDEESRRHLLERRQLHRMLVDHTWVFGEEFNLTVDDQSLTEVLRRHLAMLGDDHEVLTPVLREDGSTGIVDLMLSRRIPLPRAEEREHLVIELKRPSVVIDPGVLNQIESYAFAVAEDERFRDTNTRWSFWAIANQMTDSAQRKARQRGRPEGVVYQDEEGRITIWAKTWGQVIDECNGRLRFYQEKLSYNADRDSALAYLREMHGRYLPQCFQPAAEESS